MTPIIAQHLQRARERRGLAVVILAAGASRRLGRPKQLVTHRGQPLVRRVTRLASELTPLWIGVVVGAHGGPVRAALAGYDVALVPARRWRTGMAASLAAGVRAAPRAARHLLVLTVDQWRLTTPDLLRLAGAAGREPAAAEYAGRCGIPALFPARWRAQLLALRGDRGARDLLATGRVVRVPMAAAIDDLDTRGDLARLRSRRRAGR